MPAIRLCRTNRDRCINLHPSSNPLPSLIQHGRGAGLRVGWVLGPPRVSPPQQGLAPRCLIRVVQGPQEAPGSPAWLQRGAFLAPPARNPNLPSENPYGKEEGAGCWGSLPRAGAGCQIAGKKRAAFALPVHRVAAGAPRWRAAGCRLGAPRGGPGALLSPHPRDRR